MNNIAIRRAEDKDVELVYRSICKLEEMTFNYKNFETLYCQNLTNRSIICLVAVSGSQLVIGFISVHVQTLLHHCGQVAEIQELFVEEGFRQMNIGRELIQSAEKILREQHCMLLEVTAQLKRNQTHDFYTKAGFAHSHKKFTKSL